MRRVLSWREMSDNGNVGTLKYVVPRPKPYKKWLQLNDARRSVRGVERCTATGDRFLIR